MLEIGIMASNAYVTPALPLSYPSLAIRKDKKVSFFRKIISLIGDLVLTFKR